MSMQKQQQRMAREELVLRVLWMLLFFMVWQLTVLLLGLVVLVQLVFRLFYAAPHPGLAKFGDSLSQYMSQMGRFAVFSTEDKPWPIADWPVAGSSAQPFTSTQTHETDKAEK